MNPIVLTSEGSGHQVVVVLVPYPVPFLGRFALAGALQRLSGLAIGVLAGAAIMTGLLRFFA